MNGHLAKTCYLAHWNLNEVVFIEFYSIMCENLLLMSSTAYTSPINASAAWDMPVKSRRYLEVLVPGQVDLLVI